MAYLRKFIVITVESGVLLGTVSRQCFASDFRARSAQPGGPEGPLNTLTKIQIINFDKGY